MAPAFEFQQCPHCLIRNNHLIQFCDVEHLPANQNVGARRQYMDVTTLGSPGTPHFHLVCRTCGYEHTEPTLAPPPPPATTEPSKGKRSK